MFPFFYEVKSLILGRQPWLCLSFRVVVLDSTSQHATKLTERLLELCEKEILGTHALSITNHFRPLKRLLEDKYVLYLSL